MVSMWSRGDALECSISKLCERVVMVPINIRSFEPKEYPTHRCAQKAYLLIVIGENYSWVIYWRFCNVSLKTCLTSS